MAAIRIQGKTEKALNIYYEYDPADGPIGVGGMGEVYKGICINQLNGAYRYVAIKSIKDDIANFENAVEKARREAQIKVKNDNLLEMLNFVEITQQTSSGGLYTKYYVISEYLEGVCLDELMKGNFQGPTGENIPFAEELYQDFKSRPSEFAKKIIRCLLSGLMELHDRGYIHRDIDPTNVMVTIDNKIKLIDFGIAKQISHLGTFDKSLTHDGVFVGKPWYAAPELVLGDVKNQAAYTDIYAVGCLLYELYTGHKVFSDCQQHEVLSKQLHEKLPLKDIKDAHLRAIIEQATQKKTSKRYGSCAEFRVAIDSKRKRFPWVQAVIAVFVAVVCVVVVYNKLPEPEPIPPKEEQQITAAYAKDLMKNKQTAKKGFKLLDSLSAAGDSEAKFLLSRLYFESRQKFEAREQAEFKAMREKVQIAVDNLKAHRLLAECVKEDSTNYQALYELACDYYGGKARNEALGAANDELALKLLQKALELAKQKGDDSYRVKIEDVINGISKH